MRPSDAGREAPTSRGRTRAGAGAGTGSGGRSLIHRKCEGERSGGISLAFPRLRSSVPDDTTIRTGRGCGSMVECGLPKPETRVRFPSPAPLISGHLRMRASKVQVNLGVVKRSFSPCSSPLDDSTNLRGDEPPRSPHLARNFKSHATFIHHAGFFGRLLWMSFRRIKRTRRAGCQGIPNSPAADQCESVCSSCCFCPCPDNDAGRASRRFTRCQLLDSENEFNGGLQNDHGHQTRGHWSLR